MGSECTLVARDRAPGWAATDWSTSLSLWMLCGLLVLLPSLIPGLPPL